MDRFKNILVVANGERETDALLARAGWLAEANGAQLTLLDVIDASPGEFARLLSALPGRRAQQVEQDVRTHLHQRLEGLAEPLRRLGVPVDVDLRQGVGFIEIIRRVMDHQHDLVLKTAGQGPIRPVMAGPDLHLIRKCPCPVWTLNTGAEPRARRIVAAVDPSPEDETRDDLNRRVMDLATSLARRDGAKLDVLTAWQLPEEGALRSLVNAPDGEIELLLNKAQRESAADLAVVTGRYGAYADLMRVLHIKGEAADVITRHAEDDQIDTLVMGTLGRTGLTGMFIGNTAETVLNRVTCSVIAVKPKGFVSPVKPASQAP